MARSLPAVSFDRNKDLYWLAIFLTWPSLRPQVSLTIDLATFAIFTFFESCQ
jgi:hypothetical protein